MIVGDKFSPQAAWKLYDVMEIHQQAFRKRGKYNGIAALIWHGLFGGGEKTLPMVYIMGVPADKTPIPERNGILAPNGRQGLASAAAQATSKGYVPRKFYAYLVTPSPDFFEELSVKAYDLWKKVTDRDIKMDAAESEIASFVRKNADKIVLGRMTIRVTPRKIKGEFTGFQVSPDMGRREIMRWGGLSVSTPKASPSEVMPLVQGIGPSNREMDIRLAATKLYYSSAWRMFHTFTSRSSIEDGPLKVIFRALNQGKVREGYDREQAKIQGKEFGPPKAPDPDVEPDHPFPNVPPNTSKVIPSKPSQSAEDAHFVTANPDEKIWQNAQGVYIVPARFSPINMGKQEPVEMPAPLIDNGEFKVIAGAVYDHPLFEAKKRNQIWWYSNRNQFIAAAHRYSMSLGDRAHMALRIIPKKGRLANTFISPAILGSQFNSPEANETKREIMKLTRAFVRAGKEGQQKYRDVIFKRLGITPEDMRESLKNETRPEVDSERWFEYLSWVRKGVKGVMGLNLMASIPKHFVDTKTGRLRNLRYSRSDQAARIGARRTEKFSGEKDENGKPVEPWALYLVQYLLAHKANRSLSGATFMIPLNVLRAKKVELAPRRSLKRIDKALLTKMLREHYSKYKFLSDDRWHFVRAQPNLHFPFARLVRPMVIANDERLRAINAKINNKNIQRSRHGYVIDGVEYDAYAMIVAMPPSVAEKEFGLINRNAFARQIIDEPDIVYRLRRTTRGVRMSMREMGLTSKLLKFQAMTDEDPEVMKGRVPAKGLHNVSPLTGVDATKVMGKSYSNLPAGFYGTHFDIGKRWEPQIKSVFDDTGRLVKRTIGTFKVVNDPAKKYELWQQYAREAERLYPEVRSYLKQYMSALADVPAIPGTEGKDLADAVDVYVKYLEKEVDPISGAKYRVPTLVKRVGLVTWHAPYGSILGSTQVMTTKAPSEDVAKLIILYRLLRRSARNKAVGRLMLRKKYRSRENLFPDIHGRILAQWASMNFRLIPDHRPRGTRYIPPKRILTARSREIQKAAHMGDHRFAKMLRTD